MIGSNIRKFKKEFYSKIINKCGQFCYSCPFRRKENTKRCYIKIAFDSTRRKLNKDD